MKACVEKWLNDQFGGDGQMVADVYEEYRQTMRRLVGELASARQAGDAAADLDAREGELRMFVEEL